jgi:hypothetical protein
MSTAKNGQGESLIVKFKFIPDRFGAVLRRIGNPAVDFSLAPACAIGADRHLRREGAFLDLAINGRAGQAGAVEDGLKPDDAVWFGHNLSSIGCALMTPPANNLGRTALNEKDVFSASKRGVEKLVSGGLACRSASLKARLDSGNSYGVT